MSRHSFRFSQGALVLLPIASPLAMLGLLNWGAWKLLSKPWRLLLGIFALTQLLAALLTPDPLFSLPLALARVALTLSLILAGIQLGNSGALRPALIGYCVVAVTAFATTWYLHPGSPLTTRLVHPYYTSVSLGLAGSLGLLLALTWQGGPLWWRLSGGSLCLGMFLWSGSRGPLIALCAGLLGALLVNLRQWRSLSVSLLLIAAVILGIQTQVPDSILPRFFENTLNGRGAYWADALTAARGQPLGGVGPYQLGPYLNTQFSAGSCRLWLEFGDYGLQQCPEVLDRFRGTWLIAHNSAFHLLGETGIIGTSGWLALMGALALATWRSRDPLLNGLTWATVGMGLVDNPTLVPSLGSAELYWLAGGVAVAYLPAERSRREGAAARLSSLAPLMACALLAYFTLPLWTGRWSRSRTSPDLPVLRALSFPDTMSAGESVNLFLNTSVPVGSSWTLRGQLCSHQCQHLFQKKLVESGWQTLPVNISQPGTYRLVLTLQDDRPRLSISVDAARLERTIHVR